MTKYFNIFKTSLKQESKTIGNSISSIISFFILIYIFLQLWQYIYGENGSGTPINGYTLNMMIWYLVMAEIITCTVSSRKVTKAFGNDIKSGKIAYQLNKPYNYYWYQIASNLGQVIWKLIFLLPAGLIIGYVLLGEFPNLTIFNIVPIAISLLLSLALLIILYGFIGMFTFWIEEATPFTWIVSKFQMLLGLFFPPEFFPTWVQPIINYSPVYATMSGPSKLFVDFEWWLYLNVSISQISWIIIFIGASMLLYKLGTKKVNINGG